MFGFPKSITRVRRMIPEILADEENEVIVLARGAIGELHDLFRDLDRRIASFDKKIERVFRASEDCQRIARIKGVGPKTATAVIAAIGDGTGVQERTSPRRLGRARPTPAFQRPGHRAPRHFKARQPAPEIPAGAWARSVVRKASGKTDPYNAWVNELHRRRGFNRATAAVANKNARIIWAVLRSGEAYRAAGRGPATRLRDDGEMSCTGRTGAARA